MRCGVDGRSTDSRLEVGIRARSHHSPCFPSFILILLCSTSTQLHKYGPLLLLNFGNSAALLSFCMYVRPHTDMDGHTDADIRSIGARVPALRHKGCSRSSTVWIFVRTYHPPTPRPCRGHAQDGCVLPALPRPRRHQLRRCVCLLTPGLSLGPHCNTSRWDEGTRDATILNCHAIHIHSSPLLPPLSSSSMTHPLPLNHRVFLFTIKQTQTSST